MEDTPTTKRQFKTKSDLAKSLGIGSRQTLYNRAERNGINLDRLNFTEEELSILSGKKVSGTIEQNNEHVRQGRQEKEALKALKRELELKNKIIDNLEQDKADLSKKLDKSQQLQDQQQQLSLKDRAELDKLKVELKQYHKIETKEVVVQPDETKKTSTNADNTANEMSNVQLDNSEDNPKKHWWNIFN